MMGNRPVPPLSPVVFLDRDGVINRDSDEYIKGWPEFNFLPGSREAMASLTRAGFTLILITNQSAVARQLISRPRLARLHQRLCTAVTERGGRIKDIFFCPHHPDDHCHCRKPATGMLQQAAAKYGLDLSQASFVGDSAKDIQCARAAGCRLAVLVKTGNGESAMEALRRQEQPPDHLADHLLDAANWLQSRHSLPILKGVSGRPASPSLGTP